MFHKNLLKMSEDIKATFKDTQSLFTVETVYEVSIIVATRFLAPKFKSHSHSIHEIICKTLPVPPDEWNTQKYLMLFMMLHSPW